MSTTIGYLGRAPIVESASYFDTVVLFTRRYPNVDEIQTMQAHSAHAFPEPVTSSNGIRRGTRWTLHRPAEVLLSMLSQDPRTSVVTVHVALDLFTSSRRDADLVHEALRGSLVLSKRAGTALKDDRGTSYLPYLQGSQNLRGRQVVVYSDRPSKIDGRPCCHVELRAKGKGSVKSYGLETLKALLGLDFNAFWARCFDVLESVDLSVLERAHVRCRRKYIRSASRQGVPVDHHSTADLEAEARTAVRLLCQWSRPLDRYERSDHTITGPTDIVRGLAHCKAWLRQVNLSALHRRQVDKLLPSPRNALW